MRLTQNRAEETIQCDELSCREGNKENEKEEKRKTQGETKKNEERDDKSETQVKTPTN